MAVFGGPKADIRGGGKFPDTRPVSARPCSAAVAKHATVYNAGGRNL